MDSFIINMQNMTQAQRARAVLAKKGIRSTIVKTHQRGRGCAFALRIYGAKKTACALLAAAGIQCDISG